MSGPEVSQQNIALFSSLVSPFYVVEQTGARGFGDLSGFLPVRAVVMCIHPLVDQSCSVQNRNDFNIPNYTV